MIPSENTDWGSLNFSCLIDLSSSASTTTLGLEKCLHVELVNKLCQGFVHDKGTLKNFFNLS